MFASIAQKHAGHSHRILIASPSHSSHSHRIIIASIVFAYRTKHGDTYVGARTWGHGHGSMYIETRASIKEHGAFYMDTDTAHIDMETRASCISSCHVLVPCACPPSCLRCLYLVFASVCQCLRIRSANIPFFFRTPQCNAQLKIKKGSL